MSKGYGSRSLSILIACLCAFAAFSASWPASRAFLEIEIDVNEGWNAYFADAALGRMPLYPSGDQLITNNYPPLSFYIVGGLGRLLGDPVLAGRLLSLFAVAMLALTVVLAVRRLGGSALAGGIGAAFFVATMCVFFNDYVGMNDPHLLAQAIMALGFARFLKAFARDRGYWIAFLLMAAAGFLKHNLIVMPLTAMIWLGLHRPRQLMKSGLLAASAIGVGFALCFAAYGPDFFANLLCPRAVLWRQALGAVGHLQWLAVGLVACAYLGVTRRADPNVRLCTLFIMLALASFFLQKTGKGVAHNAQFELVFAVSIGVGLCFAQMPLIPLARRYSPDALRIALLLAIGVRFLVSSHFEPIRMLADPDFRAEIASREAAMTDTIARMRATPGDVAGNVLACYRAGKPFACDPFNSIQRMAAGKLPPDAIDQRTENGTLTIVRGDPLLSWSNDP